MDEQKGDDDITGFSYLDIDRIRPDQQKSCWIAYTSQEVHDTLKTGFDRSPMFTGRIDGTGPRYCPSIEDKINRFSDRDRHQLFVEPEGFNTVEIYLNGFSTSLPESVQYQALTKIPGFENVRMFRPGYAIEYDYFPPHQLNYSLETKQISGLFFAGQINGTTGYEEAACQGLMAGINAHLKNSEQDPFILSRSDAYIGVLIDDLITKGTKEPYRMFTSRAEHRLVLRQDNCDLRLRKYGYELGLIDESRYLRLIEKETAIQSQITRLTKHFTQVNNKSTSLAQLLCRPEYSYGALVTEFPDIATDHGKEINLQIELQLKYAGYIERQQNEIAKLAGIETTAIPQGINFKAITGLSNEAKDKLSKFNPCTLGQASRISGVSPADISVLMVAMYRQIPEPASSCCD
jgi:tRNA uridine 5-carboxymethylaminomethyl modification enzyme